MSTLWKIIVIIVIVAGIIWAFTTMSKRDTNPVPNSQTVSATSTTQRQPTADTTLNASDSSDAGMTQDMAKIDTQLNAVSQNSASVDQSFNDKAIQQ